MVGIARKKRSPKIMISGRSSSDYVNGIESVLNGLEDMLVTLRMSGATDWLCKPQGRQICLPMKVMSGHQGPGAIPPRPGFYREAIENRFPVNSVKPYTGFAPTGFAQDNFDDMAIILINTKQVVSH
jgi:hypothetical protein